LSSIFVVGGDNLPTGGRPVKVKKCIHQGLVLYVSSIDLDNGLGIPNPTTKDTELANTPGIEEQYPDEPPPPYVEQDNADLQCHL